MNYTPSTSVCCDTTRAWELCGCADGVAHVEAALDGIPDPDQRRKAKLRWSSINRVPADNAFVVHFANILGIDIKTAWFQILAK